MAAAERIRDLAPQSDVDETISRALIEQVFTGWPTLCYRKSLPPQIDMPHEQANGCLLFPVRQPLPCLPVVIRFQDAHSPGK